MSADSPRSAGPIAKDIGAVAAVQGTALCQGLPQQAFDILIRGGLVVEHGPGAVIAREGTDDQGLYVILDGTVAVFKARGDEPVEVGQLEKSGVFGERAALTEQPRAYSFVAQTDARLAFFPGPLVRRAAESAPKLGRRLAALMAGREKEAERKLAEGAG